MTRSVSLFVTITISLLLSASTQADIINVPADQPTIQDCIAAAEHGDECVVAPGTYFENINFLGKAITLHSIEGQLVTTINAGGSGTVVTCNSNEGPDTVLQGFTISGGVGTEFEVFPGVFWIAGGGMLNGESGPTVSDCTFSGNEALVGGGMSNVSSSPTVTNCTFSGNSAASGAGMANFNGGSPIVTGCMFSDNWATGGGGMTNRDSDPTVANCTFNDNWSIMDRGGGLSAWVGSSPTVTNCTFTENRGGGMWMKLSSWMTVTNCILWNNTPTELLGVIPAVTYSDVKGGIAGEGNIDADPRFVDPNNGDYHLLPGSPCIDAADNTAVPEAIVTDLDGNPRFVDDPNTDDTGFGEPPIVDMGAYEFQDPCADDDGDGRITICHLPPANPDNARTILVSMRALPAHLTHGDHCGPCEDGGG